MLHFIHNFFFLKVLNRVGKNIMHVHYCLDRLFSWSRDSIIVSSSLPVGHGQMTYTG